VINGHRASLIDAMHHIAFTPYINLVQACNK